MTFVGTYTRNVRAALKKPLALGPEMLLLAIFLSIFGALLLVARQMASPYHQTFKIDLSVWALPKYTLLSLGRGFAAYLLSLIFTLVYGTIAAHNRRAEKVMIPALDVLQAIPVLGFLPGLVLAMVWQLSPNYQLGLEMACIVMIFTGQVWNMTFSFHGCLRSIPPTLREVAAMHRLSWWQIFRQLELPSATIGLIWNSMMSMAGGWFFLTVTEAFKLNDQDYRLPGIGSYTYEAILQGDVPAMIAAIIAMVLMIVFVDQVVWRPLVVWSQRFKMDDVSASEAPKSWVLDLARHSEWLQRLLAAIDPVHRSLISARFEARHRAAVDCPPDQMEQRRWRIYAALWQIAKYALGAAFVVGICWSAWSLVRLLIALPIIDHQGQDDWRTVGLSLGASFLRTTVAVLLGAAWTLPAGILIGLSPRWSSRLQPVIQVVASFPAPMLFPLVTMLLVTLKINFNVGCTALMLLGTQWYILFNVIAGASSIPADLREVAAVYHWTFFQKLFKLYVPCVFPYLVTGLVTAAGGAWNATIVAEYIEMKSKVYVAYGLGSLMSRATSSGQFSLLAAGVVTMAVAVVTINRLLWKRLYRLAEERFSLSA